MSRRDKTASLPLRSIGTGDCRCVLLAGSRMDWLRAPLAELPFTAKFVPLPATVTAPPSSVLCVPASCVA
jgi:hypothetical protein